VHEPEFEQVCHSPIIEEVLAWEAIEVV